ncbi:MAG: hypothetical protein AAF725_25765, partial [Acidobacteriota bacterium]
SIAYVMAESIASLRWQRRDHRLRSAGVLVVDDLDRGPVGAAWHPTFALIHSREAESLAVIATINCTLSQLYDQNAALADRFRGGLVVTLDGSSNR